MRSAATNEMAGHCRKRKEQRGRTLPLRCLSVCLSVVSTLSVWDVLCCAVRLTSAARSQFYRLSLRAHFIAHLASAVGGFAGVGRRVQGQAGSVTRASRLPLRRIHWAAAPVAAVGRARLR